jgi:hypothetical protein
VVQACCDLTTTRPNKPCWTFQPSTLASSDSNALFKGSATPAMLVAAVWLIERADPAVAVDCGGFLPQQNLSLL